MSDRTLGAAPSTGAGTPAAAAIEVETGEALADRHRSRDKAVVRGASAAILAKGTTALSTIVIFAIAAKSLPAPELGVVAVLATLSIYSNLGDFGLSLQLLTTLPAANARGDVDEMRERVETTLVTLSGIGLLVAFVGTVSAVVAPWPSLLGADGDNGVRLSVAIFFICTGISIPACVVGRVLVALLRAATLHVWTAAAGIASLLAVVGCAVIDAPVSAYVFAIIGIPVLINVLLGVWTFTKLFPQLRPTASLVSLSAAWALVKTAVPYAVINASTLVAYCIDAIVVSAVMGAEAAAVYALAARLFTLVSGALLLAGQQMWSALTDAIQRGDAVWVRSRFKSTLLIFSAINAVACLFLVVFGQEISRIWVGADLVPPLSLLVVLGLYTVYATTMMQASYLLIAMGKVKTLAWASALMAPLNLVLSIALTRSHGYTGPLWGSIIAISCTVAIPIVVNTRKYFRTSREMAPAVA